MRVSLWCTHKPRTCHAPVSQTWRVMPAVVFFHGPRLFPRSLLPNTKLLFPSSGACAGSRAQDCAGRRPPGVLRVTSSFPARRSTQLLCKGAREAAPCRAVSLPIPQGPCWSREGAPHRVPGCVGVRAFAAGACRGPPEQEPLRPVGPRRLPEACGGLRAVPGGTSRGARATRASPLPLPSPRLLFALSKFSCPRARAA